MLFRKKKNPNTIALRSFTADECTAIISSKRQIMSFMGSFAPPFGHTLSVAKNLDLAIDNIKIAMPKCKNDPAFESVLTAQRDMKMIVRNFDVLASRQCFHLIQEEIDQNPKTHRHPHDLINLYLYSLTYENDSMREWVKDSSERIYISYVKLRRMNNIYYREYPKLEELLYYATTGYMYDCSEMVYNSGVGMFGII